MTYTSALTYATQRQPLDNQIGSLLAESDSKPVDFRVMSVIVPGSDHFEGAPLAADVYRSLPSADIDTVLSVAANSGEAFKRITVCSLDAYQTPLGEVKVDDKIRNELCDEDDDIFLDDRGHFLHHGLDINLPFLQKALGSFNVVPLVMGAETPEFCQELGQAVGEVMANRRMLVVACVDILEATAEGMEQFQHLLTELDIPGMMSLLNREEGIKVEGKGPLLVAMMASTYRRANEVAIRGLRFPQAGTPGFAGALIGRR